MREWNRWYYYAVGADEDARKRRAAYAAAIEPYWAKIRLPEESEEESDADEEEPDKVEEPEDESSAPEETPTGGGFYTFCMVQFTDGGTSYAYLTGGLSLKAGDFVIVPAGTYDKERLGRVTDVFVCSAQNAPYPPEQTKFVLRKATQTAFPAKKPAKKEAQPATADDLDVAQDLLDSADHPA